MEIKDYIPLIFTIVASVLSAFILVRVSIAKLEKDNVHLQNSLDKAEHEFTESMKEVRGDVKAIFNILTKIQVDAAKSHGRDEVLNTIKTVGENISTAISNREK